MSGTKLSGKGIVIQMDALKIRAAVTQLGSAMPQIISWCECDTPAGAIEDGLIRSHEALKTALSDILKAPEVKGIKKAVFIISSTQIIQETVTLPNVKETRLQRLIDANRDVYFPAGTSDSRIVWKIQGISLDENKQKALKVALWAVPNAMAAGYYTLGNACGLSVEALSFCGDAAASFFELGWEAPAEGKKAKKAKAPKKEKPEKEKKEKKGKKAAGGTETAETAEESAGEPEEPETFERKTGAGETDMCIMAEPEHLILTFGRDGQVMMQRIILRSGYPEDELNEALIALDYYTSLDDNRFSEINITVAGEAAEDGEYMAAVERLFGQPAMRARGVKPSLKYCMCLGGSKPNIDFGLPELNRKPGGKGMRILGQTAQYILVAVCGALLIGSVVVYLASENTWQTAEDEAQRAVNTLTVTNATYQGYADNYTDYFYDYYSYYIDWQNLMGTEDTSGILRTYNDNVVRVLEEIEEIMPTGSYVTQFGLNYNGMAVQFACETKEQAAYLLIMLRALDYVTLDDVSYITTKKTEDTPDDSEPEAYSVENMLSDMLAAAEAEAEAAAAEAEAEAEAEDGTIEEAPEEGSFTALEIAAIINEAYAAGAETYAEVFEYAYNAGYITNSDIMAAMSVLEEEEIAAVAEAYSPEPETDETLSDLLESAELEERAAAIEDMLTNDIVAQYEFYILFEEDMEKNYNDVILFNKVIVAIFYDEDGTYDDLGTALNSYYEGSVSVTELMDLVPQMVAVLTADEELITATEELIAQNDSLNDRYTYYLAVAMGEQSAIEGVGEIDYETLIKDIAAGSSSVTDDETVNSAIAKLYNELAAEFLGGLTSDSDSGSTSSGSTSSGSTSSGSTSTDSSDDTSSSDDALAELYDELGSEGIYDYLIENGIDEDTASAYVSYLDAIYGSTSSGDWGNELTPDSLSSILGGSTTSSDGESSEDTGTTMYYFTVAINYDEDLRNQELERKVLTGLDMAELLEVSG